MRLDYALYAVAAIFFLVTVMVFFAQLDLLWIVTTAVLGFIFVGLGYTQRPKVQAAAAPMPAPTTPPSTVVEALEEPKAEVKGESATVQAASSLAELAKVKGIGAKRSEQLRTVGVTTLEDLASASSEDLASKLKISPKVVSKWINEAKKLVEKN